MPKTFNVKKFIRQYGFNNAQSEKLAEFFEAINFTTPRHLKKVLNKYDYLVELKTSDGISEDLKNLIPDLIRCPHMVQTSKIELTKYYYYIKKDKKLYDEYLFDTIFVLYFIILYEFYYNKYLEMKNYEYKLNRYAGAEMVNMAGECSKNGEVSEKYDKKVKMIDGIKLNVNGITLKKMLNCICENHGRYIDDNELVKFITLFTPIELINNNEFYIDSSNILDDYLRLFEYKNNEILIDFCKYLISDEFFEVIKEHKLYKNENYKFKTLFEMVETLL